MPALHTKISGWGRYPVAECDIYRPERFRDLHPYSQHCIARGQGRSYGDAAVNDSGSVVLTERINRFREFNEQTGVIRAESGVTLDELLKLTIPKGWILPVMPGTRFVSLGGCIAADVHGKNQHHEGNFSHHVKNIDLILADGSRLSCSNTENSDLFRATIGGMGLTGIVTEVCIQLVRLENTWMVVEHRAAENLGDMLQQFENNELDDQYTVAWLDCLAKGSSLGRGIVSRAHHASNNELPSNIKQLQLTERQRTWNMPFDLPHWLLNKRTISKFNTHYYNHHASITDPQITDYQKYFFPLDKITNWNRMYGKRGFLQYQCVVPAHKARESLQSILEQITANALPSFLAVLKRFGPGSSGMLSFPMEGYTLALDLPIRNQNIFEMLTKLDKTVLQYNGRVYLAKDSRMDAETFRAMYSHYDEFLSIKKQVDPDNRFTSNLARRLGIGSDTGSDI